MLALPFRHHAKSEPKQERHGALVFIAQPAEETVSGARAMLEDGLFKRFPKPDYAFALHSWPLAYGTVGFERGPVSSNSDALETRFNGRGGHGSAFYAPVPAPSIKTAAQAVSLAVLGVLGKP